MKYPWSSWEIGWLWGRGGRYSARTHPFLQRISEQVFKKATWAVYPILLGFFASWLTRTKWNIYFVTCQLWLNIKLDLQSLFGLLCTAVLIGWDQHPLGLRPCNHPYPPDLGSYTRALLVTQNRRHLFLTLCLSGCQYRWLWRWQTVMHVHFTVYMLLLINFSKSSNKKFANHIKRVLVSPDGPCLSLLVGKNDEFAYIQMKNLFVCVWDTIVLPTFLCMYIVQVLSTKNFYRSYTWKRQKSFFNCYLLRWATLAL